MIKLDHLRIPVSDLARSRDWAVVSSRKSYWGYGAELADPDGYLIRLWDEQSMKEK